MQQMIYFEEMSRREIPRSLNPQGLGIIAPSINDYGTPEQQRAVPPARRCGPRSRGASGMSEPGRGQRPRQPARRAPCSTATTSSSTARRCGRPARTTPTGASASCAPTPTLPKHKGISALIIDMKTPGVERRPFPELSEPDFPDFNEVFFTDVDVPRENLLGELNGGWPITQGSLAHERAMLWIDYAYSLQRALRALVALGDEPGADGAPPRRRRACSATRSPASAIDAQALMRMGYRGFSKFMAGKSVARALAAQAVRERERAARRCRSGCEAEGIRRPRHRPASARRCGARARGRMQWLRSFGGTIPGGTSEIQRNIIAERVLGLPRR